MLPSGTQLGRYEIAAPLGAGGMGEVYRATDSRLERQVAIKVLPPQFVQDQARLARFEREAKAVAALSHPNILGIHDFATEQGQTFAVMELLDGETLRGRVAHGAIPWRRAVEIAVAIADGLAAAHDKGIIHRDLKPENIFLTADGRVKILDFGLARIKPASTSGETPTGTYHPDQTEAGTILGTVGYMSPEQVRGHEADDRSDVFSLGCLLHEMLTGQRAFARPSAVEAMAAILHDEPPELADSGKNVPTELDRITRHCLEKNPAARFHSAHDLAFALRAILSDSAASGLRPASSGASHRPVAAWALAACAALGIAAASAFLIVPALRNTAATQARSASEESAHAFDSLAILPLTNVTGDPQGEPLCEGLAEHLSGRLSQVGQLKVRPITSTVHYRGQKADAKAVGRELNVNAVVSGRLRQEGQALIVSLELVDARDNSLIWSHRYDGTRQQILNLQDTIARDLAGKLGLRLTDEEQQRLTKRETEDPEAYLLFREGMYHWQKFTEEGLKTAIEYFERAKTKDPNYAPAHAGLGHSYATLGIGYWSPKETLPKARESLEMALKLDHSLADAHAALGLLAMVHDRNWSAAERELQLALQLNPQSPVAHDLYGFYLAARRRLPEAIAEHKQAHLLDPQAPIHSSDLAEAYIFARQYDQAIAQCQKTLELAPQFPFSFATMGMAYAHQGKYEAAVAELEKAHAVRKDHPNVLAMLGYTYARWGKRDEAEKLLQKLDDLAQGDRYVFGLDLATASIHAGLGNIDQALQCLHKAQDAGEPWLIYLNVDPFFDNLRSDPRFDALLRDIGLADKPTQTRSVSEGSPTPTRSVSEGSPSPIDTLAVLPLDNQSPDPEAGYLGDDITYSLTDSLARVRELKVRPYNSAARFKAGSFDAKTAGRELQVQAVLKGAIQQRGEEIVIDVELIHVGEDRRLWGHRYPGKLAERLNLQQQIIQEVTENLRLTLTGQERQTLAKLPTQSIKAHEQYTLGRLAWNRRSAVDINKAIEHLEQAIEVDPNYALAYAGLADCYAILPNYSREFPKPAYAKAQDAALKALALDPTLAEPHCTLAFVRDGLRWDFPGMERGLLMALERKPNYPTGHHWHGLFLSQMGRHDEAIGQLQQARQLDPDSLIIRSALGRVLYVARKYDAAEVEYLATLRLAPNFIAAMEGLGSVYLLQKRYPEAIKLLRQVSEREKEFDMVEASLAYAYGVTGDTARAHEMLQEMKRRSAHVHVTPHELAKVHLGLGENEKALTRLQQGYQDAEEEMMWIKTDPIFDSLKGDPRFQKIIADMKFPPK